MLALVLPLVLMCVPCAPAPTDEAPFATRVFDISYQPIDLAIGDLDADGAPDVVVCYVCCDTMIEVLHGDGAGGFETIQTLESPASWSVDAGDMNGDGRDDVVATAPFGGQAGVSVFFSQPGGTLAPEVSYSITGEGREVLLIDADVDGDLDAAIANIADDSVVVFHNDGTGSLAAGIPQPAADGAWDVAAGDFDGNGLPDLALTGNVATNVHVLLAQGGDAWLPAPVFPPTNLYSQIDAGDLDLDGSPDLATGWDGYSVWLSMGDGTFAAGPAASSHNATEVLVADLDDDGFRDVCQVQFQLGQVEVHRGDGTGALPETVLVPADDGVNGVWAADVDLDGHTDLLTLDGPAETLGVILGRGCGMPVGGTQLPFAWDVTSLHPADVTGDDVIDLVVADRNVVHVLAGATAGSLEPTASVTVGAVQDHEVHGITSGDLDGDGDLDMACSVYGTSDVVLLPSLGGGALGAPVTLADDIYVPPQVVLADPNGDGLLDVLALDWYLDRLLAWLGTPGGDLAPPLVFPVAGGQSNIVVADFDEDGLQDVAATGSGITLLPGDAASVFGPGTSWFSGTPVFQGLGADLNGDGHADVVGMDQPDLVYIAGAGDGTFAAPASLIVPGLNPYLKAAGALDSHAGDECVVESQQGAVFVGHDGAKLVVKWTSLLAGYTTLLALADVDQDADVDMVGGSYTGKYAYDDDHALTIYPHAGPWHEWGPGLAGASGTPQLIGEGLPEKGHRVTLHVCHGSPFARAFVVAGLSHAELPFKGGLMVPEPDALVGPLVLDASGELDLDIPWPVGQPAGLCVVQQPCLFVQAWMQDPSGPKGWVASQGLATTLK